MAVGWRGIGFTHKEIVRRMGTLLLSGNEAVALAARDVRVSLGTGYPGTPSTEVLERFSELGGPAQWAPNEKVALEVGLGAAFGGGRVLVTMKHVGVNVAADPLFTAAYTGVTGALVLLAADDPGLHSSQNEQDSRRYAVAAGIPMLEPSDSQEAYDFFREAIAISERWRTVVMLRMTTRVSHSKSRVTPKADAINPPVPHYERDIKGRVMIPAYARMAHHKLRAKIAEMAAWNETSPLNRRVDRGSDLGIIASSISYIHAREAAPQASFLKLGMTYPLPMETIRAFATSVSRCVVIEEGDPYLADALRAEGIAIESKDEMYRFGELNVHRVRRILEHDVSPEPKPVPGKPPQLCNACPHRAVFTALQRMDCIVSGDIGCYTLGVLPPFEAIDSCVCMGASIGVGLGLRHVLPEEEARRVVSVIGDSTFMHSGVPGIIEMVYNPPATGHVVIIVDNGTTAMTGLQEHPGTGRRLDRSEAHGVDFEALLRAIGVPEVHVIDPSERPSKFVKMLQTALDGNTLTVIIARRPCLLALRRMEKEEQAQPCSIGQTQA